MAKGFWVKAGPNINFKTITGFFVKVSPSTWQSVNDAWVKVKQTGTGTWQRFWASVTNPDSPIEILTSLTTTTELLRLQGKNYHWTPTPSTLFYTFTYVDNNTNTTYTLTSSTSTSNPSTGSSITVPTSTTYRTISKAYADNEFTIGGLSTYKFTVTGANSAGVTSVQTAEYSMRTPKAPTLAVTRLSNTSVKVTITAATSDDYIATNRYIVSTYDQIGGTIETGGGRGGYGATTDPVEVTLTGMTAGRLYYIYVTPFTGYAGSTEANATGYTGETANTTTQGEADYAFAFGNVLHIGTNGYIGLDSGSTSDSIASTTGRVIGIFPKDLYQSTTTSIWYWSDANQFVIRWEGYDFGTPANLKEYEIVFNKNQNYALVYAINVINTTAGVQAWVKDGVTKASYAAALGTGSWRTIYFDGVTAPTSLFGPYVPKSKTVMKQVTGLTAGSQDQGYTSITTSINQSVTPALGAFDISSFTKGVVGSSSQGAARTTTLSWGQSTNATKYQIQYEGRDLQTDAWVSVQNYAASDYIYEPTRSESKQFGTSNTLSAADNSPIFRTFIRANVKALEDTGTATAVYSNTGTFIEASGTAPGQPTFNTVNRTATTIAIQVDAGSQGSNYRYEQMEYMYRTDAGTYGSTWSSQTLSSGAGTISLTGLTGGTKYWIKIRNRNYDELYSPENETNVTTVTAPTLLTGVKRSINTGTTFTNTSTTMYVSTNGYVAYGNNTPASISIPSTGYVLNIFGPNDLSQTNTGGTTVQVTYKNTSSYFVIHWTGRYLGSTTESLEYEARFYWNSDLVEVSCITNNLTALHYQSDNAVYNNGTATKTWASNSSSLGTFTLESSMTAAGAPTATDDGYTAITASKPIPPKSTGTKRIIPLGVTVTSGSTIAYVSTNGYIGIGSDPGTVIGIPSTGRYLNIYAADLRQTSLFTNATSTTYSIKYKGTLLGDAAQIIEYEIKFTFGSTSAEVFIISNTMTTEASDTVLVVNGTSTNTWSGTNASTMTSVAATALTTQDGVDDARTAITLTAPVTVSIPTNATVPTLTGGVNVGDTFTFGVGTWNNTPTSYSLKLYRGTAGVATSETLVKDSGNTTSDTYVILASDYTSTPTRRYFRAFATATNSAGTSSSGTYTAGAELGPITNTVTVTAPGAPTIGAVSGSGSVSWTAPTTGGAVASYEIEFYTATNSSGGSAAGPYTVTGISASPYQLTSPYGGSNNYARARVLARNTGGASAYSAWAPSATTYA